MAGMAISVRNVEGTKAFLRQYGERAKARAKVVVENSAERSYQTSYALAPKLTGFMANHLLKEFTPSGFGYRLGFRESDFTAAGKELYPRFVIWGTRFMAGRDFLFAPFEAEKPRFRAELKEALRPG